MTKTRMFKTPFLDQNSQDELLGMSSQEVTQVHNYEPSTQELESIKVTSELGTVTLNEADPKHRIIKSFLESSDLASTHQRVDRSCGELVGDIFNDTCKALDKVNYLINQQTFQPLRTAQTNRNIRDLERLKVLLTEVEVTSELLYHRNKGE